MENKFGKTTVFMRAIGDTIKLLEEGGLYMQMAMSTRDNG